MMDWLSRYRLEHLAETFEENEIDSDLLFELTDEDLKEMGLSLGARKRLRKAIEASRDETEPGGTASEPPEVPPQPETSDNQEPPAQTSRAERRQLTVMFVDLAGSTALSSKLDPEDMRDVMTAYQNMVAGVVTRYAGHVAKYMGDGVLCYFGWPHAHEDDAERAVRAALEIVAALGKLPSPTDAPLSGRIGIATGLVVVGDLIGEGAAQEEAVVGDTPNLAARLQSVAAPDEIVVSATTRQLLGNVFELADLGALTLKGLAGTTPAWRILSERDLASRFEAHTEEDRLPMVGREHELALIVERWMRAMAKEGQVSMLIGEAGIGKSRLTRAFIEEAERVDCHRISLLCSPYHTDSSFHPVIQQLSRAMGIAASDSVGERLDKLEANLRAADPQVVAELMHIDGSQRYGAHAYTPQQLRNRILDTVSEEIRALSREKPVFLVVEDAHWIDASTLAVLEACLDKIAEERVFILITARPTFEHSFGGHPIVSKLALNRLGADQTAQVLSKITGGKSLPPELVSEIVARTDGVPLFVEELTKTIIESGELRETATGYELIGPVGRVSIPATLHDSLMARIDRLQPVKEIAQIAACIGREFGRAALAEIARVSDATLDEALGQLEKAELVFRRGIPPDARYVFKHALVRDVAYESLLKKRRQEIHGRLVAAFEADAGTPPELTAHHATEAGLLEKAVVLWQAAGTAAQARPAYDEAVNHLKTALATLERLEDQVSWQETRLSLLVQLAQIYVAKEGYASAEASDAFFQALESVAATENPELRVAIFYGTWIAPYIGGQLNKAYELSSRLVADMEHEPDLIPRLISRRMRAATSIAMGRPTEALADLAVSYRLYQDAKLVDFAARFAQDPGVQILSYRLLALWMHGDEAAALADRAHALERARALKHANTLCYAGLHAVTLSIWRGDIDGARAVNEEMRKVAMDHDMALWKIYCDLHDRVMDCMEDRDGAAERLEAALSDYQEKRCGLWVTLYLAEQAKHLLRLGDRDGARNAVARACREMNAGGERWAEAELHRIKGEIWRLEGDGEKARQAFEAALAVVDAQEAHALEGAVRQSLAKLSDEKAP